MFWNLWEVFFSARGIKRNQDFEHFLLFKKCICITALKKFNKNYFFSAIFFKNIPLNFRSLKEMTSKNSNIPNQLH